MYLTPAAFALAPAVWAFALWTVLAVDRGEHGLCKVPRVFVMFELQVPGGVFLWNLPEHRPTETRGGPLALRPSAHVVRGAVSPANGVDEIIADHGVGGVLKGEERGGE